MPNNLCGKQCFLMIGEDFKCEPCEPFDKICNWLLEARHACQMRWRTSKQGLTTGHFLCLWGP